MRPLLRKFCYLLQLLSLLLLLWLYLGYTGDAAMEESGACLRIKGLYRLLVGLLLGFLLMLKTFWFRAAAPTTDNSPLLLDDMSAVDTPRSSPFWVEALLLFCVLACLVMSAETSYFINEIIELLPAEAPSIQALPFLYALSLLQIATLFAVWGALEE